MKVYEWMIIADYRRIREYRKEKLDNIFKWLGVFVYSSKGSRVWKSGSADKCRY